MEAIILAGGFGTRLSHIVSDVPKPMAPVCNRPFLEYLLDDLNSNGFNKVVMAVGYKSDVIENYFGEKYKNIHIAYSVENKPLYTGGAIKLGLRMCTESNVFIINGDTFFKVNFQEMAHFHMLNQSDLTIATKEMFNFDRYGTVQSENGRIVKFKEKGPIESGFINGGIYLASKDLLDAFPKDVFSFESEFMEKNLTGTRIFEYKSPGYFIDIGIPEDYYRAQIDFMKDECYE